MAKINVDAKTDWGSQLSLVIKYMFAEDWDFEGNQIGVSFEIFDGQLRLNKDGTWRYEE